MPPEIENHNVRSSKIDTYSSTEEKEENQVVEDKKLTEREVEDINLQNSDFKCSAIKIDTTDKPCPRQQHSFAAKKTVAQGLMDVALLTSNANQLRYVVEYQRQGTTFWIIVILIIFSLLLQIAVGVSLIFKGRFDIKGKSKSPQAKTINNYVVVGIFLITIINIFIATFGVASPSGGPVKQKS